MCKGTRLFALPMIMVASSLLAQCTGLPSHETDGIKLPDWYATANHLLAQAPVQATVQGDRGFIYFAAEVHDESDQPQPESDPHLTYQLLQWGPPSPSRVRTIRQVGARWHPITAMVWHDHRLHVLNGPNYSVLHDDDRDGFVDRREDLSQIILWPPPDVISGNSGPLDTAALLKDLADRTKSNEVRIGALWMLWKHSLPRSGESVELHSDQPDIDPTKAFITALHNGPEPLRAEAARVLRVSPKDTQPAIKGLIHRAKNDTSAKVRTEAALTLGYLQAKDAVVELFGSLDDPDDTARTAKIMALRLIGDWELAPAFVNAASERTREGAILALSEMEHGDALKALAFAVQSSAYPEIRLKAVQALDRASIMTLANEARDSKHKRLVPARWNMIHYISTSESVIVDALRTARQDEDAAVRQAAGEALEKIYSWWRMREQIKDHTDLVEIGVVE